MQKVWGQIKKTNRFWFTNAGKVSIIMLHKATGKKGEFVKEFELNGIAITQIRSKDNLLHFAPTEEFEIEP